jgi:dUTP pyrophosphatase
LIPTGIVLDIPEEHYVEIYSRSGTAIKKGLTLINSVGIIDEDYTKELFIPFINLSQEPVRIYHGDRIAQGILKKSIRPIIIETPERPVKESNRDGGFGSTGV